MQVILTSFVLAVLFGPCEADSFREPHLAETEQERPCNAPFATVSVQEIYGLVDIWLETAFKGTLNETEYDEVFAIYSQTVQYPVLLSRVCGSCSTLGSELQGNASEAWRSYCGNGVYGYNSTHSSLVLHPIDPETGAPLPGRLNGHLQMQGARFESTKNPPSLFFPRNNSEFQMRDFFSENATAGDENAVGIAYGSVGVSIFAAASGMVSIAPDDMGTGASIDLDRSFLTEFPVQQASGVAWLATKSYTSAVTNGCTELSDTAIVNGYSLGGFNAAHAAATLDGLGVEIELAFIHAAPTDLPGLLFGGLFNLRQSGSLKLADELGAFLALTAAAYSNEMPFLANTGTNQTILSELFSDPNNRTMNIHEWVNGDPPFTEQEIFDALPFDSASIINPVIIDAYETSGGLFVCVVQPPAVDILCHTLIDNSATKVIQEASFPIQRCHSPDDEVVPIEIQLTWPSRPDIITDYDPPNPLLVPSGTHEFSNYICKSAIPVFIGRSEINAIGNILGTCALPTPLPTMMTNTTDSPIPPATAAPVPPPISTLEYIGNDRISSNDLLSHCQGDCDSNYDCAGELVCYQRIFAEAPVFGCAGTPGDSIDYCIRREDHPADVLLYLGNDSAPKPLGLCEGDCDCDSDCQGSLKCFFRVKDEQRVPGCSGYLTRYADYCVNL